jgi:methionyl-tRNA formyltransferase
VLLEAGVRVPLVVTHATIRGARAFSAAWPSLRATGTSSARWTRRSKHLMAQLASPDFIFSFYYRRMLPPGLLAAARRGAFNMHGSLLPKYRGRAPLNWAISRRDRDRRHAARDGRASPTPGASSTSRRCRSARRDRGEVFRKVTDAAERSRAAIRHLSRNGQAEAERPLQGQLLRRPPPEDGRIDWSKSAAEIHNLVRAVAPPYPGRLSPTA